MKVGIAKGANMWVDSAMKAMSRCFAELVWHAGRMQTAAEAIPIMRRWGAQKRAWRNWLQATYIISIVFVVPSIVQTSFSPLLLSSAAHQEAQRDSQHVSSSVHGSPQKPACCTAYMGGGLAASSQCPQSTRRMDSLEFEAHVCSSDTPLAARGSPT